MIRWAPIVIFHTFAKCCVLRYYYYVGTRYVFFSSTASHDLRIFTIASIRSPDKEIDRGIRDTSRQISFEFLFLKTCPPDKLHNGFRCGIELSGGRVLIKRNSKEPAGLWYIMQLPASGKPYIHSLDPQKD